MLNWRDREQQLTFIGMEGLVVEALVADTKTSKFDLTLILTDDGDEIGLEMEYCTDLFDDARIERMVGHYQTLLAAAAADPQRSLADLPLLAQGERQQILVEWNRTEAVYPKDRCVHELIEEQAQRAPDAVAAVFKGTQLTYRQLNARANQLAHHLQKLGVGPDTLVGICVERSLEMVVGLLGILKAGGAYVPLDPGYPKERLAFMLRDSGTPVLLTHSGLRTQLRRSNPCCQILCLDADWGTIARSPTGNPKSGVKPENLAYVIYTSGSTGEPKGVELMHGGLLNLIFWHRRTYQVKSADKATQLAGVGFDASVWELWPYLSAGGSIYMPDEDTRLWPEKLRDWLVEHEITLSFVPTPLAEALVALPWPAQVALRALLTGGDRLTCRVPPSLPFPLVNHYGPTESTVVTTCAVVDIDGQDGKAPPIGRPIANTRLYLLDTHLQPVPIGVPGEVYIGGDGLARGYWHRPDLTGEKFIADPFSDKPGSRLYKTGDLARYSPTGTVEFLGRNDAQVKIRGFRIELGEIESALAGYPGVGAAVVVAREDGLGEKRLVAYVTIHSPEPTVSELREHLKKQIPDYMVPWAFVMLEQCPLTSNGKVDRAALPAPDSANSLPDEAGDAPVTEVEKTVAGIVAALLGLAHVDAQANFFDLGGHSLMGTQLIAQIRGVFGIDLPLRKVFESPTVAQLSVEIEQILVEAVEAMSEGEIRRALDCQQKTRPEGAQ
jgi:amino acid adenylation domain-containing protein